jgi:hypothetical protein
MNPSAPARRPWTVDEKKKMDDLMEAGKTAAEIATALERKPTSIYSRLQRLEIKRRPPPPPGARAEGEKSEIARTSHRDETPAPSPIHAGPPPSPSPHGRTGAEGEEMSVPNHRERQLMQELRGAGWVRAIALPASPRTIEVLLRKGWIERRGAGNDISYRITDKGLAAKSAPVRI